MYRISWLLACSGLILWGCSESATSTAEQTGSTPKTVTAHKLAPAEQAATEETGADEVGADEASPQSEPAEVGAQSEETSAPGEDAPGDESAQRVRREVEEAGNAVADWAAKTKQQLITMAERRLTELDNQLAELKRDAQDLDDAAKARFQEETKRIERKRREFAQQLDELKNSSDDAWKTFAEGIAKAFADLKQATKNAIAEFE